MKNIKDLVLTIIEEKIQTNSFKDVNMDSIAKELHISKRTIYEIFESKESILEMALDRYQRKLMNYANSIATKIQAGEISFTDGIHDLMKHISEKVKFNSELYAILPKQAKKINSIRKNIFMKFYDIAVAEGIVKKEINKEIYFNIVQSCALAVTEQRISNNLLTDKNISNIIADYMNIINLGVLTDKGRDDYIKKQKMIFKGNIYEKNN